LQKLEGLLAMADRASGRRARRRLGVFGMPERREKGRGGEGNFGVCSPMAERPDLAGIRQASAGFGTLRGGGSALAGRLRGLAKWIRLDVAKLVVVIAWCGERERAGGGGVKARRAGGGGLKRGRRWGEAAGTAAARRGSSDAAHASRRICPQEEGVGE
jgi:hypothetical protein